jgi:hypothetical protein
MNLMEFNMNNIEKFRFVVREDDPDWIYLTNDSPMYLSHTEDRFRQMLGEGSIAGYPLGGFTGFMNSFRFKKIHEDLFLRKILPQLTQDEEGYYRWTDSLNEANEI